MRKKLFIMGAIVSVLPFLVAFSSSGGEDECCVKDRCCGPACERLFEPCKKRCCRPACDKLFKKCERECCTGCRICKPNDNPVRNKNMMEKKEEKNKNMMEKKEEKNMRAISPRCGAPACDKLFEPCKKRCCRPACDKLFEPCEKRCCRPACDHLFEPCPRGCK